MTKDNNQEQFQEKEKKTEIHTLKKVSNLSVFIYKNFKLVVFLEVFLVLIMGYFFIIRTEFLEIRDYDKLFSRKQEELKRIEEYKGNLAEFEKKYNILQKEVEADINVLYDILPPKEDLPNLMAQMEALAKSYGFTLGSINMSSGEKSSLNNKKSSSLIASKENADDDLIKEVNVSVFLFGGDGNYQAVKELLDAFEHHIRFMDVISFSFEKEMKTYSILLKTYYLDYEE